MARKAPTATTFSSQESLNALMGGKGKGTSAGLTFGDIGDYGAPKGPPPQTGTSIFDPVLCELLYRWFSPPGGAVLDPFAGGSVRGVVAAKLGRRYVGVELRAEQVQANRDQWPAIAARALASSVEPVISDPDALTPVQDRGGVFVKRDDLFGVGGVAGGKVRTCLALARQAQAHGGNGLVTAGSRASPQVNIVARVAAHLGMSARCHTPQGELSPEVRQAQEAGADIVQHKPGHNSVIIARAREDAKALGWAEIPFGMECAEAITQTRRQVANLPAEVTRIVMPAGSGMSLAGVLHGLDDIGRPEVEVLAVRVGADPSARLDRYAPADWRGRVTLVPSGSDYHDPAPECSFEGIALDPHYEAKCLPFLQPGDLFWVVGVRATAAQAGAAEPPVTPPVWIEGDSRNIATLAAGVEADFIFSCPPYADLEVYSDDPQDLSTLDYPAFRAAYADIILETCSLLKPDRFACFVVGDVRDAQGFYYGFPAHTQAAFEAAGLRLYNEAILVTAVGSLPVRVGRQFTAGRKLGKTHQNILVFCKGDPRKATEAIGPVDFGGDLGGAAESEPGALDVLDVEV